MKSDINEQENIRRYLLGRVPPQDLPAFEERFFVDNEPFEELSIIEDELIDEYLRGELSASDRERFESHFMLAPERHEKMRFARALKKRVSAESASQRDADVVVENPADSAVEVPSPKRRPFFSFLPFQNPIVSYALTAAMLLIVGGVSWVAWKNWRSPDPRDPGNVMAVVLTPGLTRSDGETKKISMSATTGTVRLELLLPENQYQTYEASLLDFHGRTLTATKRLQPETAAGQSVVPFTVAAELLPPGDYRVKLNGVPATGNVESIASYPFRILAQ